MSKQRRKAHQTSDVTHPTSESCVGGATLGAFVRGELSPEETDHVAAHLDVCEACWRRAESDPVEAAFDDDLKWAHKLREQLSVDITMPPARSNEPRKRVGSTKEEEEKRRSSQ